MKNRMVIIIVTVIFLTIGTNFSIASNEEISKEEVIESQQESLNIAKFIKETQKYTEKTFSQIDIDSLFRSAIKGNIDNKSIIKIITNVIGKEVINCISILGSILVIILIHSIFKSISEGLKNITISQITYYVQYILIATLIMTNFADILNMIRNSITNLIGFTNNLIPLLVTLMLTTGNIASATLLEPIILFIITFIGNFIKAILLPFVLIANALSIISNISDKVQIYKLSKFLKSSVSWVLGIILTIFVGTVSIEGTLSSAVDGIAAKTAKATVSNVIPVVGKILADAADTVIGCNNILKNAVGIIGVIVVLLICILPIIKLLTLMSLYYLASAVCEPIADKNIVRLLEQMGDTFKILFAILCSISVMLMIGITLVIKITNSGLMYR